MWNLSPFREVNLFDRKMLTVPALWNIMKFQHFFKVHQISSNLQNSFESSSETCMWNLSPFREVIFFHKKMLTVQALEISWNFNIFSKFTKFHQTCRTYLNHHQKHACEIWANSEKLTYFTEKWRQCRPFEISWNFNIFSKFIKFHQTCRTYLNHHQKHACEIWENSEKTYFIEKCWQCGPLKYHEISTFFQSSPNFIKLAEHIGIIIRNMHVKFEPIQKSWLISQKNADSAGPLKYHEISTFFQSSPNFIKLAEHIWIIIRNMHVKLSQFREVDLFHRKMLTMPALWIIMKFQHFFKVHQISSNLQNLFESSSETCMWNLSQFREVIFFHRKMLTVPALEISWNFNIFSKVIKFHQTCRTYLLESSSETWMWNLSLFREVDLFHRKCWQCRPFEISWNFNIFSKFTKFHQTCRIYWNHHQKHACEIWARSEKLYFSQKNADSAGPRNIMKISTFIQCSQNFIKMQNLLESSSETCMWNLSPFREVIFFHRKMLTVQALEISWNFNIFSKFIKFDQTCRTYWNHHQKHACEIWAFSEKLTYFIEKCWQYRP